MTPSRLAPSRYHLAISRLIAVVLLLAGQREECPQFRYLSFAKGQSRIEVYSYSLGYFVLSNLFLVAFVEKLTGTASWALLPLFIILIPVTFGLLSGFTFSLGLIIIWFERLARIVPQGHERAQFALNHTALSLAAVWGLLQPGWIRYVGAIWFAMLLVNATAAIILMIFSRVVVDLETRHGASAQAIPFRSDHASPTAD